MLAACFPHGFVPDGEELPELELTLSHTFSGISLDEEFDAEESLSQHHSLQDFGLPEHPWEHGLGQIPDMPSPRPTAAAVPYTAAQAAVPYTRASPAVQPAVAPVQRPPPPPGPPSAPAPARVPDAALPDPAIAGQRFGLTRLGLTAGSKLPCPVATWVAGILYLVATDGEISGSDDSLTGLTMSPTLLEGGSGSAMGLQLRFAKLTGPKPDLICRIARKVMELMGQREGMFRDWEALRKHLTENRRLDFSREGGKKVNHFSFIWTGSHGGNLNKDFSQTYFERRFTPDLDNTDKFTDAQRHEDRLAGGGGNPGLLAYCGWLLQRDYPGLYAGAKEAVLGDIANGLQLSAFEALKVKAADRSAAAGSSPEAKADKQRRKSSTRRKLNGSRHAEAHIRAAHATLQHPAFQRWMAQHPEAIARRFLAARQFTAEEIAQIERLFQAQSQRFTSSAVNGLIISEGGLAEFRKTALASSPAVDAPGSPPASSSASSPVDKVAADKVATDLGLSLDEAAGATASAGSAGSLTRQRSLPSEADDDGHRLKRSTRSMMSSKGPEP